MTWVRFGSEITRECRWEVVTYEARWHYHAILAECADSERFDCRLPMKLALRASDVPDPEAAIKSLVDAGIATIEANGDFCIPDGEYRHMPPVAERDKYRKSQQRKWTAASRKRKGESQALRNDSSQHDGDSDLNNIESLHGQDDEYPTPREALLEGLHQNRTEQNRTALSLEVTTKSNSQGIQSQDVNDFYHALLPAVDA